MRLIPIAALAIAAGLFLAPVRAQDKKDPEIVVPFVPTNEGLYRTVSITAPAFCSARKYSGSFAA